MSDAPTAEAILTTARRHRVALIVVGSHGGSPPPLPRLGGVSSALVQRTDVPLLVVPSPDTTAAPPYGGPILICFDGSTSTSRHQARQRSRAVAAPWALSRAGSALPSAVL